MPQQTRKSDFSTSPKCFLSQINLKHKTVRNAAETPSQYGQKSTSVHLPSAAAAAAAVQIWLLMLWLVVQQEMCD